MKLIHLGDLHFSKFYKGNLPIEIREKITRDIWENFLSVISYVEKSKIDLMLLAGDLFEREYFSLSQMNKFLFELEKIKIPVFIVCGNHDFLDGNSIYKKVKLPENVHLFGDEFSYVDLENLKTRVFGISYNREYFKEILPEPQIKEDYNNILLIHAAIEDGNFLKLEEDYAKKFDYVAMGHVHKRGKVFANAYYCGSLEPMSFKETGDHGFIEVDLDSQEIHFVNSQVKHFQILDIEIDNEKNPEEVLGQISKNINDKDLYRIRLRGRYRESTYLLSYLENNLRAFYFEIENYLLPSYSIEDLLQKNDNTLLGKYINSFNREDALEMDGLRLGIKYLMEASHEN